MVVTERSCSVMIQNFVPPRSHIPGEETKAVLKRGFVLLPVSFVQVTPVARQVANEAFHGLVLRQLGLRAAGDHDSSCREFPVEDGQRHGLILHEEGPTGLHPAGRLFIRYSTASAGSAGTSCPQIQA